MKGHKSSILIVFLLIAIAKFSYTQTIALNTNNSTQPIKFAQHYGDNIFLIREVSPNDLGKYLIYNDSLSSGMYYLIMSDSTSFEFLYDSEFSGKIVANYNIKEKEFILESAPDVTMKYDEYQITTKAIKQELTRIKTTLRQNDLKNKEKRELQHKRTYLQSKTDSLTEAILLEFDQSVLGSMMKAQLKVEVPEYVPSNKSANHDSASWAWRTNYYKKHYLDNFNINDERLIYTPLYTSILNKFLDKISSQQPEDLCQSIDFVLNKVEKGTKVEEFISDYILNKYNKLKNDANYEYVYVHLIESHYLRSGASWLSNDDMANLSQEYNRRKPLLIGQKAPVIELREEMTDLYDIDADKIVVYFFNYDCEHCKTVTNELKKISIKTDSGNVAIYAVCLGINDNDCQKYISSKGLNQWHCSYNSEKVNKIAVDYNLSYTPTLFLLDRNKTIISKNLTINQLKELLNE